MKGERLLVSWVLMKVMGQYPPTRPSRRGRVGGRTPSPPVWAPSRGPAAVPNGHQGAPLLPPLNVTWLPGCWGQLECCLQGSPHCGRALQVQTGPPMQLHSLSRSCRAWSVQRRSQDRPRPKRLRDGGGGIQVRAGHLGRPGLRWWLTMPGGSSFPAIPGSSCSLDSAPELGEAGRTQSAHTMGISMPRMPSWRCLFPAWPTQSHLLQAAFPFSRGPRPPSYMFSDQSPGALCRHQQTCQPLLPLRWEERFQTGTEQLLKHNVTPKT